MINTTRNRIIQVLLSRFPITVTILFFLILGCNPVDQINPPSPPPASSLLLQIPYVGDETEIRTHPPQPVRMVLNENSVHSWLDPSEAMLRFPVEIRESARLSLSLGAITRVPIHIGDLIMRIEYVPEELPPESSESANDRPSPPVIGEPVTLFQTTPVESPMCFQEWIDIDISLDAFAPGRGEIRFVTDGPKAGDTGLDLMWGEPVIYHPAEQHHRHVLLIGVDTLRRDSLTPYGAASEITPNLQELAETSTTFDQARSQAPWTLPSFASMITGRLPSEISAMIYTGYLPERNVTIGELLLTEGYATATICSNTWLGNPQSGFHQGMEEMWFRYNASASDSVEKTKDFIARSNGRDWFCFLHIIDPHVPYAPPMEFVELFCDPAYTGLNAYAYGSVEDWKSGEITPEPDELAQSRNLYDGEVAYTDRALGDLFDYLEETELIDDTLIIFASDHGEEFFDHGGCEHGHTQYDELVHMPLIVRGTGFPQGERFSNPVGNTDIVPTILEYTGLEMPGNLAGNPLQEAVRGTLDNSRLIFGEDNSRGDPRKFAVEWPYKCILNFVTGEVRLYDLENDPGETVNISEEHPDLVNHLSTEIVTSMLPDQTAFHVWITRSYREAIREFTGTIRIPGGIDHVKAFKLSKDDYYLVEGDTVTFSITSSLEMLGPNKHLLIVPAGNADTLDAEILVDGRVQPDRFFPYGSRTPEPSCRAVVSVDDFPLGPSLPLAIEEYPAGCYIWGVRGYDRDDDEFSLDEETEEQLRALGYIQ